MLKLTLFCFLLFSCAHKKPVVTDFPLTHLEGKVFGSTYQIKYHQGPLDKIIKSETEHFFYQFKAEFSTYKKDSLITQFNQLAPRQRLKVSLRFIQMLELAQMFHQETEGAFDPSIGSSIKLWGFGGGKNQDVPSSKKIKTARRDSGMDAIKWDSLSGEAWKTRPVILDLNAFAPGWAADLLGQRLKDLGVQNFMINIGGEILFKGTRPDGTPWRAGIESPDKNHQGEIHIGFQITNLALATSGNYRQFRTMQGKIRSHIINPKTHEPVENQVVSVSVIAPTAAQADAWSTALMVKGEKGLDLAEKKGLKVYLIKTQPDTNWEIHTSPSMKTYLESHGLSR